MAGAGSLDRRFRFERREEVADGAGNYEGAFVLQFTAAGRRQYLRGGESVLASRLTAQGPAILTVRVSTQSRQITADWRAVDTRSGEVFNIRETPRLSDERDMFDMMAEAGVAT